jgi:hypothetical protein
MATPNRTTKRRLNAEQPRLAVIYRKISDLKANPKNPRRHSRSQVEAIKRSIEQFGNNNPILVDGEGNVLAGHGRLQAAIEMGCDEVPTICLSHLKGSKGQAFAIADNKIAEGSEWIDVQLNELLLELAETDPLVLEATGFSVTEIDLRLQTAPIASDDPADEVPSLAEVAVSRLGDVWEMDKHLVICGSALDAAAYDRLLGGEKAQMSFNDSPWNLPAKAISGLGRTKHRDFAMGSGEMTGPEFTDFLIKDMTLVAQHSGDGSLHFYAIDWRHLLECLTAGGSAFSRLVNFCVWVKNQAGMGSHWRSQHELFCVYKFGSAPHRNNVELGKNGRFRTNVWNYPSISSFGHREEEGSLKFHPTCKPVSLVADAILDCTRRGDVVLDTFLGSGSTLLAAERTGRRCRGIELDPLYIDTGIRRWQRATGKKAINRDSGLSFDELAAEANHE